MQLRPNQLAAQLKSGLAPSYLIAGEEPLLVIEAADAVRRAAQAAEFSERVVLDNARPGFSWAELNSAGQNLSLFASKRRIEVKLNKLPGRDGATALKAWVAKPPADTLLLVTAGQLDKSARASAWYKALAEAGAALYIWPVAATELGNWLQQRARALRLSLSPQALAQLEWRVEGNLLAAAQALQRLQLLAVDGQVDEATIAKAVSDVAHFGSFDLVDALLKGDTQHALRRLERLREEGTASLDIIGALAWALHALGMAAAAGNARDQSTALRNSRVFGPGRQALFMQAIRRLGPARIAHAQRALAATERVAKGAYHTGLGGDAWSELLRLCALIGGIALPRAPTARGLA